MRRMLLLLTVVFAVLLSVLTGAIIGVGYYQAGIEQGAADEQDCDQSPGETCDLPDEDSLIET